VRLALAFALLFAASSAHADSASALAQVCGQLIGSQVTQCQAAGGGRHIDDGAAQVCGQLIGTQVVQCVGAIAGKDYNSGETANCGQLIGTQVTECMRVTGRAHRVAYYAPPPPPPQYPQYPPRRGPLTVPEIRAEVAAALESIRANDPMGADRRLRKLLNELR
jgi:hypothetical protein